MTPALPVVSGAETIRALGAAGFQNVGQRGSHIKLRNAGGRTVIVPMHDELARGDLRSILRQAGLSPEQFVELL